MQLPDLVLRDIHVPAAPAWWPPAPGWWGLCALVMMALAGVGLSAWWRQRRRRRWQRVFDEAVASAPDAAGRVAAMSSLLRRAARRVRADADRLDGDAWLAFLDAGTASTGFVDGPGAALRDAGFRRDARDVDLPALHALARARFVAFMTVRR